MRAQQRLHGRFIDVGRGAVAYVCVLLGAMGLVHGAEPPSIENVRYTEDYGYLKTAESKEREALAPWDSLKFIPLNQSANIYLTLGAEFRLRYERYDENNWGDGPQDDDGYLWARVLPLADLHVGNNLRFFGQFISAFAYDLDMPRSPVDEDRADLMQAFAEARCPFGSDMDSAFTLRPGRQLLTFGSGRLIDVRYGPNVLQTFDAVRAFVETGSWRFDAFYAQPAKHHPGEFDDRTDQGRSIWSLYGTVKSRNKSLALDAYYIGYQNKEANFGNASGREQRHTLGSRLFGKARGWDWNFEAFYQFGDFENERSQRQHLRLGRFIRHRLHVRETSTFSTACAQGRHHQRRRRSERR